MWVRDGLPKHVPGIRTVIYGYDTKLHNSPSFQSIPDLANELIVQLRTSGWDSLPAKPIVFLAHSLGGIVLRQALVQLASSNKTDNSLLGAVRGAVFFGVPNLGMEQADLRNIIQSNPNEALVDDIARNSHYLRRLNEDFFGRPFSEHMMLFWAYETSESPTAIVCQSPNLRPRLMRSSGPQMTR